MKISYKGDYALKAVLSLALKYWEDKNGVLSIKDITASGDMPIKFLEQILLALKRGGFVKSRRGINGGFCLARPPKEITVGEVIRFIEGPIEPISCIENEHYKGCKDFSCCIFRNVWKEVKNAISVVIDTLTFEELVLRYKDKQLGIGYGIDYMI